MKFYIVTVHYSQRYGSYDEFYAICAENEESASKILEEKEQIKHDPQPCYGGTYVEVNEASVENNCFKIYSTDN